MHIISNIKKDNSVLSVCWRLCKYYKIKCTHRILETMLSEHPNSGTFLQIGDIMEDLGVMNMSIKLDGVSSLVGKVGPFVIQIKDDRSKWEGFAILYSVGEKNAIWFSPYSLRKETVNIEYLESLFTGYVQIYDEPKNWEISDKDKILAEKVRLFIEFSFKILIPILVLGICFVDMFTNGLYSLWRILYVLLLFLGTYVSYQLFDYESGNGNNAFVHKMCAISAKSDCTSVLRSSYSHILGISLSHIGLSFFMGSLLVVLIMYFARLNYIMNLSAWLNILSLPYIIFSVFYQARTKHWCLMCLSVVGILISLFIVSYYGGILLSIKEINIIDFVPFIVIISLVFIFLFVLIDKQGCDYIGKYYQKGYIKYKYNPITIKELAFDKNKITEPDSDIGITLGNPNGRIRITKVCNPYCSACASSHGILDNIVDNNTDVCLRMLFSVGPADDDTRNKPLKVFLAKYKENPSEIREVLDTWYFMKEKDYEKFLKQYPVDEDILKEQTHEIKSMYDWCEDVKIEYTPTLMVNGRRLVKDYYANDLKFIINSL